MRSRPRAPARAAFAVAVALIDEGVPADVAHVQARRTLLLLAAARAITAVGIRTKGALESALSALRPGKLDLAALADAGRAVANASGADEAELATALPPRAARGRVAAALDAYLASEQLVDDPVDAWQLAHEDLLSFAIVRDPRKGPLLAPAQQRRTTGAHYTPRAVTDALVTRAIAGLEGPAARLGILDPAMGAGSFLVGTARHLSGGSARALRSIVAERVFGADLEASTVAVAHVALWLLAQGHAKAPPGHLRHADALVGSDDPHLAPDVASASLALAHPALVRGLVAPPFHRSHLPRGTALGLVVGNPPWISYAGRAAQPLAPERRAYFATFGTAFGGYRSLQALFVDRFLRWLVPGGRLGFVLPTSMSDLDGYAPFRTAHDRLAVADADLVDFGDGGFEGVFQPCMGLVSTRVASPPPRAPGASFAIVRRDVEAEVDDLLRYLGALPCVPRSLFGERGFQTTPRERALLSDAPLRAKDAVALRNGSDLGAFRLGPPSAYGRRSELGPRLRPDVAWAEVRVLVRQTARFPIAAISDGLAFRNSILAAFDDPEHAPELLVAYLNATPIRLYHHARVRDARQGMPQMKIAHLRAIPDIPSRAAARAGLLDLGRALSRRNDGIGAEEQEAIDELACDALDLDARMRSATRAFRERMRARGEPGYKPRA